VDEVVGIAVRRWRSSPRRKGGRRDRGHDLGRGLADRFVETVYDHPHVREDWMFLAAALADVLQQEGG